MRNTANNLTVLRIAHLSQMNARPSQSRIVTTLIAGVAVLALALVATRSAAAEKQAAAAKSAAVAAEARHEQLAALVADRQAAAQKAIEASKKLTAVDEGEVVLASARIPAAGELLQSAAKVRTIKMVVTAYCPCKKCCGKNAQGITASGKRVSHNNGRFVAADTKLLPFGKKLVVPGYSGGTPVEVLDTGSAIKGKRLDVYFASHQKALEWGKRSLDVVVID